MKNIAKITIAACLLLGFSSCTDKFLDEVKKDAISSDYRETPEGLASLAESLYMQTRDFFYGYEYWAFVNTGADEFMIGGDGASEAYNTYDARLSSIVSGSANTQPLSMVWDVLYPWIANANTILNNGDRVMKGSPLYNETMGTAYFTRAFDYLTLVIQYGDIPLVLEAATKPEREYTRNPRKDVYAQIISDLEQAYQLLPEKPSMPNKYTKYVAAHYLAKAHLWRASEINDDFNSEFKSADLAECIKYADIVLAAHPLVKEFNDLFANFTAYDTDITENNTEIVYASSNTHESAIRGWHAGNSAASWYVTPYQNTFWFIARDVASGRSYQRMKATPRYVYNLYDLENDSRFWKSFKTTFAVNSSQEKAHKDYALNLPDGTKTTVGAYYDDTFSKYISGMYVINHPKYGQKYTLADVDIADNGKESLPKLTIKDYATDKYIPSIKALVAYDDNGKAIATSFTPNKNAVFTMLNKYLDGALHNYNEQRGWRDFIWARSAEDLFFKAEALIRQGKYDEGIAVLKPLRDRAQYKAGEARDEYHDGGQAFETSLYRSTIAAYTNRSSFYPRNSYFYSIGGWDKGEAYRQSINAKPSVLPVVTSSNYPEQDEFIMQELAKVNPKYASDAYTRAMCYLLNEKSREMYGEFLRWPDLARTKTIEDRLYFNDQSWSKNSKDFIGNSAQYTDASHPTVNYVTENGGNFNKSKHYVRPIPQNFLDLIYKNGKPLSTEEKQALQNPGY